MICDYNNISKSINDIFIPPHIGISDNCQNLLRKMSSLPSITSRLLPDYMNFTESLVTYCRFDGMIRQKRMDISIEELRTPCNRKAIK